MGHGHSLTLRAGGATLPLLISTLLAGCVGLPSLETFKYATQAEREDAALADGALDVDLDDDTATGDTAGQTDAVDAQDGADQLDAADQLDSADELDSTDVADAPDVPPDQDAQTDAADAPDAADTDTGPDVPPPECVTSTDCNGKWTATELGQCQSAACVQGACVQAAKTGACDDANVCTDGDLCSAGKCTGTSIISCNDGDACSADKCDPKTGCYFVAGAGCEDGNDCTTDTCDVNNLCVHLANDATCSDNNACTTGDVCGNSVCAALDVTVCNDDNACTDDSCDPTSGCVFLPNAVTCDDSDICTVTDACAGGSCGGVLDTCSDGNPCTDDACDAATGCLHVNNYEKCDDGNKCTPGDNCIDGGCVGLAVSATAFCNDNNPCTDDSCSPTAGCSHDANSAPCDDGLPCTVGDVCAAGKCTSGASACECKKDADCAVKEDGNPCNGSLVCDLTTAPYKCVVSAKTIVVCDAAGDTVCAKNTCSKVSGLCSYVAQQEGGACDADGSVCTDKDTCKSGDCAPGAAVDCDDGKPCTTDSCDNVTGCVHVDNTNACNDGSACTIGDACSGGACVPGAKTVCDDGNACTLDTCNASTGSCNFAIQFAATCDDGNACSQSDTCDSNGVCVGTAVVCNDSLVCTSDTCNPASGCVYTPNAIACNDDNACTTNDACGGGGCAGTAVTVASFCDDGNPCTVDTCDPLVGCKHTGNDAAACDDGNTCTTGDKCVGTVCTSGTNNCTCTTDLECAGQEDGNKCNGTLFCDKATVPYNCKVDPATVVTCSTLNDTTCAKNTCNITSGACQALAQNDGLACNADNSVCTPSDTCNLGVCTPGGTLSCNDANPCTNDACDPVNGCKHVNNTNACSDGNACTTNDTCANALCVAGAAVVCTDNNPCTTDTCNTLQGGCSFVNNTANCDDGSLCTTSDKCAAGSCGGTAVNCNDNNVCTDDACVAASGCTNNANVANCTDGSPCTIGDTCANKTCQPGGAKNCNDNNTCTTDSCNAADGMCINAANSLSCNDNSACTTGDVCANKSCLGTAITCNDGSLCTSDTCQPATGCTFNANINCDDANPCSLDWCVPGTGVCAHALQAGLSCEDGDPCTTQDYCSYYTDPSTGIANVNVFVCKAGSGLICDDANGCTVDACNYGTTHTCSHTALVNGSSCGVCSVVNGGSWFAGGTCNAGTCTMGAAATCDDSNQCTDDGCTAPAGCMHMSMQGKECDDNDLCTTKDACDGTSKCGGLNACDDGLACTQDQCAAGASKFDCTYITLAKGVPCDDGDACTSGDACDSSQQCSGEVVKCDDGQQCTADSCDKYSGCVYTNTGGNYCVGSGDCPAGAACLNSYCWVPCDDGNACTSSDHCGFGSCYATGISGATTCSKNSDCGGGSCVNGYCNNICTDNNACTANDYCSSSGCTGTTTNCNDNDACTLDTCSTLSGCAHSSAADDSNVCTNDACTAGTGVVSHTNVVDFTQCGTSNFCKTGVCYACPTGTVATAFDDSGVKKLTCALDYPVWGILPLNPNNFTDTGNNTISDGNTGLMWSKGQFSTATLATAISSCDSATFGNYTDWRLPTVAELQSITDYVMQASGYSLNNVFFGQGARYWAQPAIATLNGFDIDTIGGALEYLSNTNAFYARCVRGTPSQAPLATRYTLQNINYGDVYDNATGLLWYSSVSATTYSQSGAATACTSNGAGWRLPTIRELESIIDRSNAPSAYLPSAFVGQTVASAWTSTPLATGSGANPPYWYVNFTTGTAASQANNTPSQAMCVKSCDDSQPCTIDSFDKVSWSCKATNGTVGSGCGGSGTCSNGICGCPAGAYGTSLDDGGTAKFQCIFDYPVWGITALAPPNQASNGDSTVIDSKTGLQWQDGKGSASTFNVVNAKAYCDGLILGGKADWRLPSPAELDSLVDYTTSAAGPNINTTLFSGTVTTGYWTSRANAQNASNAWYVMFANGQVTTGSAATTMMNARCVRGTPSTSPPATRFTTQTGTPTTVKDNATGLTWEQTPHGSPSTYIQGSGACSSPWHLPTIRELGSIVDRSLASVPALNSSFNGGSGTFWSATTMGSNGNAINFNNGNYTWAAPANTYYVRCVK